MHQHSATHYGEHHRDKAHIHMFIKVHAIPIGILNPIWTWCTHTHKHREKVYNGSLCVPSYTRNNSDRTMHKGHNFYCVIFLYSHSQWTWSDCTVQGIGEPNIRSYFDYVWIDGYCVLNACLCTHPYMHTHMHSRHSCVSRLCIVANRMRVVLGSSSA